MNKADFRRAYIHPTIACAAMLVTFPVSKFQEPVYSLAEAMC